VRFKKEIKKEEEKREGKRNKKKQEKKKKDERKCAGRDRVQKIYWILLLKVIFIYIDN
jgi:hypothetical protein